jgi:protein TonB
VDEGRALLLLLLLGSLTLHASLLALFRQEPQPYSSVGIPAVSVEIVLGAYTPAGVAQMPTPYETQESAPTADEMDSVKAPPVAESKADTGEVPAPQVDTELPIEGKGPAIQPNSERPAAKPTPQHAQTKPESAETESSKEKAKQPSPVAARSAPAANGIGRGRSYSDADYHGLVAAHLARHKQYPTESRARREEGTASIAFTIDGSGRVTSVRLARTSGVAALDQESVAMVRRASPFPAPPDSRSMSFTVPVSFHFR